MKKIKIVADSSSNLFALRHVAMDCAPMKIITSEREFVDDPALNVEEMVEYLSCYKGRSQSSCPNTGDWLEAFGDADEIFCVTVTSGLSGSYNSACAAKQIYESEHEGRRVQVLDTRSAGPEVVLLLERLEECIEEGMSFEELGACIAEYRERTGLLFMLKSLTTFANNGRVSPMVAKLVGMAGICIVGRASTEGTLEPRHKCRGERRSLEALVSDLEAEGFRGGKIRIAHTQNEAGAEQLRALILAKFKDAQVEIHRTRGLCSFYAERGGILLGFERS